MTEKSAPWWKSLTPYHWFVFIVASAAWFFDCLDQRLFSLARIPALADLMDKPGADVAVQAFGKQVTAWFLIGWGIGGLIFGALGDRYGRARMLTVTILIYSTFTGLSFFSHSALDFTICRFLTGAGVGGVFGLAVALIAETVPSNARVHCLGLLQVLSTIGNISAVGINMIIGSLETNGTIAAGEGWRWMFLVGAAPACLILLTWNRLKEPESWLRRRDEGKLPKSGIIDPYRALLREKRWRKNLVIGMLLASTGVVGLWAIGEYAVDLQTSVFESHYKKDHPALVQQVSDAQSALSAASTDATKAGLDVAKKSLAKAMKPDIDFAKNLAYLLNMIGAGVGMWIFTKFAHSAGRKPAFLVGFSLALIVTVLAYLFMNSPMDAYWMMPLMGAVQLGVFAGFAIYLPELFPGRLRSTGTSFCYNIGRFAAAGGSFFSATLSKDVFGGHAHPWPLRYSAVAMCAIFLVGIITALVAPETKGQPLPEDDIAPA